MVAQKLGKERLDHYLRTFGFGKRTGIGFPGEPTGLLLDPKDYWVTSMGTVPIGNGLAVSALQMLEVYATIANGGVWRTAHAGGRHPRRRRASATASPSASPAGSSRPRPRPASTGMLRTWSLDGTGTNAAIPGYTVARQDGDGPQAAGGRAGATPAIRRLLRRLRPGRGPPAGGRGRPRRARTRSTAGRSPPRSSPGSCSTPCAWSASRLRRPPRRRCRCRPPGTTVRPPRWRYPPGQDGGTARPIPRPRPRADRDPRACCSTSPRRGRRARVCGDLRAADMSSVDLRQPPGRRPGRCSAASPASAPTATTTPPAAVAAGAAALLVERFLDAAPSPRSGAVGAGRDGPGGRRRATASPSRRLRVLGVTGTNGKTTTTYLLEAIARAAGLRGRGGRDRRDPHRRRAHPQPAHHPRGARAPGAPRPHGRRRRRPWPPSRSPPTPWPSTGPTPPGSPPPASPTCPTTTSTSTATWTTTSRPRPRCSTRPGRRRPP